jgi:cell division protein FtsB
MVTLREVEQTTARALGLSTGQASGWIRTIAMLAKELIVERDALTARVAALKTEVEQLGYELREAHNLDGI